MIFVDFKLSIAWKLIIYNPKFSYLKLWVARLVGPLNIDKIAILKCWFLASNKKHPRYVEFKIATMIHYSPR